MDTWSLVYNGESRIIKNAAKMLCSRISVLAGYPVETTPEVGASKELFESRSVIVIGTAGSEAVAECEKAKLVDIPSEDEGYSVYVGKSIFDGDRQLICIAGRDERGVLYGCADLLNDYCGNVLYKGCDIWREDIFDAPFSRPLPEWRISRFPAVKTRAVWTWGHVIYDYRGFFENMARIRLNEIVIWNDHVPKNAREIVDFAHSFGIKVVWGFAWGWSTSCREDFKSLGSDGIGRLKNEIIGRFENEYSNICGDGIYFQSFTEFGTDKETGKAVAEKVTELVNSAAGELLSRYPGLHIQFGLHATSVKEHLDIISKVDPRIYIVWEDCGAFPFNYDPYAVSGFDNTLAFTGKLLALRGSGERFGAVLKGMLKLDWTRFFSIKESIVIGERDAEFIKERQKKKDRIWKIVQAGWLKNAEYAQRTISLIAGTAKEPIIEALIEDAMLENRITFPAALYAEILWTPDDDTDGIEARVAGYPSVCFANN